MRRGLRITLVAACLAVPAAATGQPPARLPADGGTTFSLGQPGVWLPTGGLSTGLERRDGEAVAVTELRGGMYVELLSRVLGLGGLHAEGYGGLLDTRFNGGVRLRAVSPFLRLGIGVDYSGMDKQVRPLVSFTHPVRRGGVRHDGSMMRIDYRGGPERMVTVGVEVPFLRKIPLGTTRPREDRVVLRDRASPDAPLPVGRGAVAALDSARHAAHRIQALIVPWADHTGGGGRASDSAVVQRLRSIGALARATTVEHEVRRWHAALDVAFSAALHDGTGDAAHVTPEGRRAAVAARAVLLDEVIVPYDRLLGQAKDHDTTRDFALLARGAFLRWLHVQGGLSRQAIPDALGVFGAVLDIVEEVRRT
ncbi:MAG: hypothetical protein ACK55A_06560, partial [Gemmatimonas sp.]